jgi:hypothetical protein
MVAAPVSEFEVYGRRGQEIIMVLYALRELGAIHTKQDVLRFIREHHFYDLQPEDKCSYESKREWKADTLLCFGRKDAVMGDWMFDHDEKDSWELARPGYRVLDEIISHFRTKRWQIHKCFLWSSEFKKLIDPTYVPSSRDDSRPLGRRQKTPFERALELLERLRKKAPALPSNHTTI